MGGKRGRERINERQKTMQWIVGYVAKALGKGGGGMEGAHKCPTTWVGGLCAAGDDKKESCREV